MGLLKQLTGNLICKTQMWHSDILQSRGIDPKAGKTISLGWIGLGQSKRSQITLFKWKLIPGLGERKVSGTEWTYPYEGPKMESWTTPDHNSTPGIIYFKIYIGSDWLHVIMDMSLLGILKVNIVVLDTYSKDCLWVLLQWLSLWYSEDRESLTRHLHHSENILYFF